MFLLLGGLEEFLEFFKSLGDWSIHGELFGEFMGLEFPLNFGKF